MPAPRKPTAVLVASGAYKRNPNRQRNNEPKIDKLVGEPPTYFNDEQVQIWNEIKASIVEGVALLSDKFSLELLCNTLVQYRRDPFTFTAADKSQLKSMLNSFGMSPTSRANIEIPQPKEPSIFAEFDF